MSEKFQNNPFAEPLKNFKPEKSLQEVKVIAKNNYSSLYLTEMLKDEDAIAREEYRLKELLEKLEQLPESEELVESLKKLLEELRRLREAKERISKPEHIPNSEEIKALFEKILGEVKYDTRRKLEDEQGLYLWEIEIPQEKGSVEYSYIRKGDYKARGLAGGSASETAIHVTYFDEDGIPVSGHSVFKFIDNKWIETL